MSFFDDEAYFFFQLSLEKKKKFDLKGIFYFKYLNDRQEAHAEKAPVIAY